MTQKTKKSTPVLLAILDGWGYGPLNDGNAIHLANTPNMDRWMREKPFTTLVAHNGAVGLPEGQMGNSEVGHLNIGAGRTVYQDFTRINRAVDTGDFFSNPVLKDVMTKALQQGVSLHFLGLLSDGGVHSHQKHLDALLKMAWDVGVQKVFVHAFMDGRDTPPDSGVGYMRTLVGSMAEIGVGQVATVCGRYYAMDRDNRWDRVEQAWQALVDGEGIAESDPVFAVENAYARGETDEFIKPVVLKDKEGRPVGRIKDGDAVIVFNFRADRVRQISHALNDAEFSGFPRKTLPMLLEYVTFTQYDKNFTFPVAFPPVSLSNILGEVISAHGLSQLRIAETEKYAHVTYFFNGGREQPFPLEDRVLIPSPRDVATYDQKPAMSAYEVTDELLRRLDEKEYAFIVLNFANGDMVGHTGVLPAAIKACEAVDECLGRIVERFTGNGGTVLVTSDHGNAEDMKDSESGKVVTAHSSNPVPFILIHNQNGNIKLRADGSLTNIAPTILDLMGLDIPQDMESESLLVR